MRRTPSKTGSISTKTLSKTSCCPTIRSSWCYALYGVAKLLNPQAVAYSTPVSPVVRGVVGDRRAKPGASSRGVSRGVSRRLCLPRVSLRRRPVVRALVGEARAGGPSRDAQGTGVVGDKGPIQVRYVDRDGGSALPGRGPVRDAPEEEGSVLRWVARAAVGRTVDDAGEGQRAVRVALLGTLPYRDLQGDFVEPPRARLGGRNVQSEAVRPSRGEPFS